MASSLVFWSVVTIIIRSVTVGTLIYVAVVQYKQFKYKSRLQPLKRLLFYVPMVLIVTTLPQFLLSFERANQTLIPNWITNLATVSNSLGSLITAVLLILIYNFKDGGNV